ncbi:trigger factor [Candidatus Peregrinibacteria bacterium]|nr:trigger factor [Candidatus Peregrinibacteria bacterium]
MKVDIKKLPKSEVELTITVPYETYQKWEKKALEDIGKNIKISGFRPGNIPEDVIRKNVEPESIKAATFDYVLPQTYAEAVQKNDLHVVAQPKVDIKKTVEKEGDEFVYTATVAVMPEVKMGDYKKIKVARKPAKVEAKSIDDTIQMIMDRYAEWKDVERKAEEGDRAELAFEGFDEKGEAIPNTVSKNHPVILGSKTMVPGFEEAVAGMGKGETREFEVKFPKDYHAKPMQGKKVKFKVTLNRLEAKKEQILDEDMVEKITGKKQSVEEFKKLVEEDLKKEIEYRNSQAHDNAVVSEVIKITKADLPEALIEQELGMMLEEQKRRVQQQGLSWEQYLGHIKKTEDDFKKDHRKGAEERVLARLGIQHIIKDADLKVEEQEVDKKIQEIISQYPEEQQKMARDHFEKDDNARRNIRHNMAADKLIDMLSK